MGIPLEEKKITRVVIKGVSDYITVQELKDEFKQNIRATKVIRIIRTVKTEKKVISQCYKYHTFGYGKIDALHLQDMRRVVGFPTEIK